MHTKLICKLNESCYMLCVWHDLIGYGLYRQGEQQEVKLSQSSTISISTHHKVEVGRPDLHSSLQKYIPLPQTLPPHYPHPTPIGLRNEICVCHTIT